MQAPPRLHKCKHEDVIVADLQARLRLAQRARRAKLRKHGELSKRRAACASRHVTCSVLIAHGLLEKLMAIPTSRSLARPVRDEWGVYDPQVAGLAALFARLDSKDSKAPAPEAPAAAATTEAAPARPALRDAQ